MAALRAAPLASLVVLDRASRPVLHGGLRRGVDVDELIDTLCELGRVDRLSDLGANGPLLASAGVNSLFHCLFGRDAIRMAMDLLDDFPAVARSTLLELARLQGVCHNPRGEEEPGRMLHEHRELDDPRGAELAAHWDFPYFGAVDTTPQWVNLLAAFCLRFGPGVLAESQVDRRGISVTVRESLVAALGWTCARLDAPAGGGYLWVQPALPTSIGNQVFEDSSDSYYEEDGTLLSSAQPFAPVAVQAYAYDALLNGAQLLERSGATTGQVAALRGRAALLRRRVLTDFWQADLGTFALAMICGPERRPARVVSSSAGHLLDSRLLEGRDAAPVRQRLMTRLAEPDLLAAGGVRTRSTTSARFRPGSYHNGSTWPVDTGVIADGLRRFNRGRQAADLERRVLAGCAAVGGFPEFLRGEDDQLIANTAIVDAIVDGVPNRLEQPPQVRQGWTATRVWRILMRSQRPLAA